MEPWSKAREGESKKMFPKHFAIPFKDSEDKQAWSGHVKSIKSIKQVFLDSHEELDRKLCEMETNLEKQQEAENWWKQGKLSCWPGRAKGNPNNDQASRTSQQLAQMMDMLNKDMQPHSAMGDV